METIGNFNNIESLENRLKFSDTVYEIAANFVSSLNLDVSIPKALGFLGEVCGSGRSYIFEWNEDGTMMSNTYEWCNRDVAPQMDLLQNLPVSTFPWWIERLNNRDVIFVPDVDSLPEEADAEKSILQMQGVKSVLVLPLIVEERVAGFIGLDDLSNVGTWHSDAHPYLSVASDLIGGAITRSIHEKEILLQSQQLKEAYQSLKVAQAQLLQKETLASIGRLAAGLAHEMKNPIGFIDSNLETLSRYMVEIEKFISHSSSIDRSLGMVIEDFPLLIDETREGISRVVSIIDCLKDFYSVGDDVTTFFDINKIIRQSLTIVNSDMGAEVDIKLELSDVGAFWGNPNEFNIVFSNLFKNAIQAVSLKKSQRAVACRTILEGDKIVVEIEDSGDGIPEPSYNRVFEPFFTAGKGSDGAGLGLTIVHNIVTKRYDGFIDINTGKMGGALFRITLPVSKRGIE